MTIMGKLKRVILCAIFLFGVVCVSRVSGTEENPQQPEKALLDNLFRDYERDALPVTDPAQQIPINVSFTIMQLVDMDVKEKVLTMHFWIQLQWTDKFMRWNPEEFSGIKDLRLPIERIWMPDLELYNGVDSEMSLCTGHTPAVVKNNGSISWIESKITRTMCDVDVTYFPFDRQSCKLKLGSWAHDGLKMDLIKDVEKVEMMSTKSASGEWDIVTAELTRAENYYSCCPEPYVELNLILDLQRSSSHYLCGAIIPCVMLSIIALLTITMPPDSVLRIGVETLILITFSHFMVDITSVLPSASNSTPLILVYLVLMMVLTYLAIVFTAMIWKFQRIGMGTDSTPLPNWFKNFILSHTDKNGIELDTVSTTTRDDAPLTSYAFMESMGDGPGRNHVYPHATGEGPAAGSITSPSGIPVLRHRSNSVAYPENIWLARFAAKLDRIGLWFFAVTITLVNLFLFIIAM